MANSPLSESPIERSARRKIRLNVILPAFLISIVAYLDRNNVSQAKLVMNGDLGFSETVFGFGAGIFFAGYILFEVPGALIAERFGARLWLARIMVSWGLLTGLMAFIREPWHFYWLRFLIGAAEASLYPVLYATVIPRWFTPAERPRAIALLLTSLQVSAIVGAPLAGWLIDRPMWGLRGWQALFVLEALPAVVLGVVVVFWLADSAESAWWLTPEEKAFVLRHVEQGNASLPASPRLSVREALTDRVVLKLAATYFLWMTGFWGFNTYTPSLLDELGWSHQQAGWLIAGAMVLSLLVMLWVGHNSSRTGEKRWHGASGMFLAAVGMYGGATNADPYVAYGFLCLAGVGVYSALGVWWSYPTTFLSGPAAAGAVGLINSVGSAGGFLGPYLTGFVKDATGGYGGAWTFLSGSLAAAGCMILTLNDRGDDHRSRSTVDSAAEAAR